MPWNATIDAYCERLGPGFWGEPLNAISNLAFCLTAWLVWWRWHAPQRARSAPKQAQGPASRTGLASGSGATSLSSGATLRWDINTLLTLQVLIGAGSFAFHTFATRWAGALDVLAIALYLHFFLAVYAHRVLAVRWPRAWLGMPAFLLLSQLATLLWAQASVLLDASALKAVGGYLGAWTVLLLLVGHSLRQGLPCAPTLAGAAAVFALSLCVRQLDMPLCHAWPWGTHFAWHLLNATTLGLTSQAMVRMSEKTGQAPRRQGRVGVRR